MQSQGVYTVHATMDATVYQPTMGHCSMDAEELAMPTMPRLYSAHGFIIGTFDVPDVVYAAYVVQPETVSLHVCRAMAQAFASAVREVCLMELLSPTVVTGLRIMGIASIDVTPYVRALDETHPAHKRWMTLLAVHTYVYCQLLKLQEVEASTGKFAQIKHSLESAHHLVTFPLWLLPGDEELVPLVICHEAEARGCLCCTPAY